MLIPRSRLRLPFCAALTLWLCVSRAAGQAGMYVPTSAELLLRGRPAEGLLVLRSGVRNSEHVDVDALVFTGATADAWRGDVLTVSVLLREPHGLGAARLGRFVIGSGAIGPLHIDGVELSLRAFRGSLLAVYAGVPVAPELGPRDFDWLFGGRLGQELFERRLGLGLSYAHRRNAGELDTEAVGADAALHALPWLSLHAVGSWSLVARALAELRGGAVVEADEAQVELFGTRRVAARLLPQTSLFSVISTAASSEAGTDLAWQMFPRLSVGATFAVEELTDELGYRVALRCKLRLADTGPSHVGADVLRSARADEGYSGAAVRVQVPISESVQAHASAELVAADRPRARGELWPWLRGGASWTLSPAWLLAGAVGIQTSPLYRRDLYALVRVGYQASFSP